MLLLLWQDILIMVVKLIFTEINFPGRKYLGVIVGGGGGGGGGIILGGNFPGAVI